jgi:hypothetical protein
MPIRFSHKFPSLRLITMLGAATTPDGGSALAGAALDVSATAPAASAAVDTARASLCLNDAVHAQPTAAAARPIALTLSSAALSFALQPAVDDPTSPSDKADATPAVELDKSGTDPTKFLRTLGLRNEYQRLPNDKSFNLTTFTYIEPFANGRMNLRLKAPLAYTDAAGDDKFGLSDISLRYNWLAHVDASKGILLSADLTADSATEDVLGRGKWYIGPAVTYAMFLSPTMIFAPAYQHNISFAGDGDRRDVNESVIDLYMVFTAEDKKSWFIVDPTLVIDWENDENTPFTLEAEYGRNIGTLFGGALNFYVRPGIGIGQDRPYDWNIEVGFTVVGF